MRVLRRLVLVPLAALAGIVPPAAAKPPHAGSLDRTFGDEGRVVLNLPGERMRPRAMLVQSDGRIVVAGYLTDSPTQYEPGSFFGRAFAVRFLADGSLDRSFGEGGVARSRLRLPVRISGLGIQPDGALLLAGTAYDQPGRDPGAVLRLLPNGALDDGFGTEGLATVQPESVNPYFPVSAHDLTQLGVLPDGRILAAGTQDAYEVHTPVDPFMVRLLPNGAPDPASENGVAGAWPQWPAAMVAQPDGSLVVLGTYEDYFGEDLFVAHRVPGHRSLADTGASYQWKHPLTGAAARLEPNGDILFIGSLQATSLRADLAWVRIGPDLELLERGTARSPGPVRSGTFDRRGAFLTMTFGAWDSFTLLRFRGRRFHQDRSFGDVDGRALVGMPYRSASIGMAMQGANKLIVGGWTERNDPAADQPVTLYRLHARQDAAPPALRLAGLRPRACLDVTRSVVVRARDESRFLVRVSLDGRRVETTRKRRLAIALDPGRLDDGRHRLTVTGTDAAGNRSRRERTFRVCKF
jgi:uncharacterized delta-60 repeat protein